MILYFTGTGNSGYVAKRIGAAVDDEVLDLFDKIRNCDYSPMASEKPWVIAAPTYAWQLPNIVKDWLSKTVLEGSRDVYFVLTCGDSVGNAADFAKKYCSSRQLNFKGLAKVVMPENYIAMFSAPAEAEALAIVNKAEPVIDAIAETIKNGGDLGAKTSLYGAVISGIVNKSFYKFSVKDSKFTVSDVCSGCGLCEKGCVTKSIVMENGKPRWTGKCTHCMACICSCPQEAIEYGNKSKGQPRYKCPK